MSEFRAAYLQGIASLIGSVGQDLYNMYGQATLEQAGSTLRIMICAMRIVSGAASDIYVLDLMAILLG